MKGIPGFFQVQVIFRKGSVAKIFSSEESRFCSKTALPKCLTINDWLFCKLAKARGFSAKSKVATLSLRQLKIGRIEVFLRRCARTNNRFSMQHVVATLSSDSTPLGFSKERLHLQIDTPRVYRLERLPRAIPWNQVQALLCSIDRSEPYGLRDFTLLYLAAAYGLRSGELVRLTVVLQLWNSNGRWVR